MYPSVGEYRINSADLTFKEDSTADDLIDVIEGNRAFIPAIYVMNKIDQISIEELDIVYKVRLWRRWCRAWQVKLL